MGKNRNSVDWDGMQQLVSYLELKAKATDDDVKMAIKNNTTEMYREAFKRAPVDTFGCATTLKRGLRTPALPEWSNLWRFMQVTRSMEPDSKKAPRI